MSDVSQGEGWWAASDGKWYPPEQHPNYTPPTAPAPPPPPAQEVTQRWDAPVNPAPAGPAVNPGHAPTVMTEPLEVVVANEEMASSKAGLGKWLPFALVGLVAIAGVAFLVTRLAGSESATGATTPEDALSGMVAAMDEEDVVGIISLLDPEEARLFNDTIDELESDGVDLSGLPGGFDFTMHGLGGPDSLVDATFSPLGDENSGLMVARMDGMEVGLTRSTNEPWAFVVYSRFGVQAVSADEIEVGSTASVTLRQTGDDVDVTFNADVNDWSDTTREFAENLPLELVFVESDGKWFLSLGYTVTNLLVQTEIVDAPDYGRWRRVLADGTGGAETPTAAVQRLFNALPKLDVSEAVLAMDPVEARLLHDFLPVIEREFGDDIARELELNQFNILDLQLGEEVNGDTALVYIDAFDFTYTNGYGDVTTVEFDRSWCVNTEDEYDRDRLCLDAALRDVQLEFDRAVDGSGVDFDLRDLIPDRPLIVTTQREGRWYVSPLATFDEYATNLQPMIDDMMAAAGDQVAMTAGTVQAQQIQPGEPVDIRVEPDGIAAVVFTPEPAHWGNEGFDELDPVFQSVHLTPTDRIDVQHNVGRTFDEAGSGDLRLFGDETTELIVFSDPSGIQMSNALVFRNTGTDAVTVTIDYDVLTTTEIEGRDPYNGAIGADGLPQVFRAPGYNDLRADGAEVSEMQFERLPWFELFPGPTVRDSFYVIVTGEPGAAYTLSESE